MKYGVLQCELCRRSYAEEQVMKIKLDFSTVPVRVAGTVEDYYMGIRVLCHFCVNGIKSLPNPETRPSSPQ